MSSWFPRTAPENTHKNSLAVPPLRSPGIRSSLAAMLTDRCGGRLVPASNPAIKAASKRPPFCSLKSWVTASSETSGFCTASGLRRCCSSARDQSADAESDCKGNQQTENRPRFYLPTLGSCRLFSLGDHPVIRRARFAADCLDRLAHRDAGSLSGNRFHLFYDRGQVARQNENIDLPGRYPVPPRSLPSYSAS